MVNVISGTVVAEKVGVVSMDVNFCAKEEGFVFKEGLYYREQFLVNGTVASLCWCKLV